MIKKGIVMKTEGHRACIMTEDGQFVKVKINKDTPEIGEIYTGKQVSKFTYLRYTQLVASVIIALSLICFYHIYYTPAATVVVSINPSIKLETNCWDRIIKIEPLNKDGGTLLKEVNIKNKTLDDGLKIIIKQAINDKYLTDDYNNKIEKSVVTNGTGTKKIKIYIEKGNKSVSKNVEDLKKYAAGSKLNIDVKSVKYGADDSNKNTKENLNVKKASNPQSVKGSVISNNKKGVYNGPIKKYGNTYRNNGNNPVNKLLKKDDKNDIKNNDRMNVNHKNDKNLNRFNKIQVKTYDSKKINAPQKKVNTFNRKKVNTPQKKDKCPTKNNERAYRK